MSGVKLGKLGTKLGTRLGIWAILLTLSLPAWAAEQPGAISGYVRSAAGTPQMGAVVQILGAAHRSFTVFTDDAGFYTATGLLPGLYTLKVTAPSFLPVALRRAFSSRSAMAKNGRRPWTQHAASWIGPGFRPDRKSVV